MKRHIAAIAIEADSSALALLEKIVALNEGEAFLFASAGIISTKDFRPIGSDDYDDDEYDAEDGGEEGGEEELEDEDEDVRSLGTGYLKIKVRKRLTEDGGKSILANSTAAPVTARAAGVIPPEVAAAMVNKRESSGRGRGGGRGGRGGGLGGPSRLQPPPMQQQRNFNPPIQPRQFIPPQVQSQMQPQQNGGRAGQNNGWDQWDQPNTLHQQSQNGTWDPHQGVNGAPSQAAKGQTPKKDPALKAQEKAARKQAKAVKVGTTNGTNGGGAPLPKKPTQQQEDPGAAWA